MTTKQRTRARLVQALYRWQVSQEEPLELEREYLSKTKKEDDISKTYFKLLFANIIEKSTDLNNMLDALMKQKPHTIGLVEQAILWLACYELLYCQQTSPKVIINEAIELAKNYGGDNSYKLINSILEQVYKNREQTQEATRYSPLS